MFCDSYTAKEISVLAADAHLVSMVSDILMMAAGCVGALSIMLYWGTHYFYVERSSRLSHMRRSHIETKVNFETYLILEFEACSLSNSIHQRAELNLNVTRQGIKLNESICRFCDAEEGLMRCLTRHERRMFSKAFEAMRTIYNCPDLDIPSDDLAYYQREFACTLELLEDVGFFQLAIRRLTQRF